MYFIVTEDWLESNKTKAGRYTTAQIKALGWEAGMKAKKMEEEVCRYSDNTRAEGTLRKYFTSFYW